MTEVGCELDLEVKATFGESRGKAGHSRWWELVFEKRTEVRNEGGLSRGQFSQVRDRRDVIGGLSPRPGCRSPPHSLFTAAEHRLSPSQC